MATQTIPLKRDPAEQELVSEFAEIIALHGWKVTGYGVKQDIEKQERTLSITAHRSTGEVQQENMDLRGDEDAGEHLNGSKRPRRKRKAGA